MSSRQTAGGRERTPNLDGIELYSKYLSYICRGPDFLLEDGGKPPLRVGADFRVQVNGGPYETREFQGSAPLNTYLCGNAVFEAPRCRASAVPGKRRCPDVRAIKDAERGNQNLQGPYNTFLTCDRGGTNVRGERATGFVIPKTYLSVRFRVRSDGSHPLETAGKPGALPGEYKVAISDLVSAEGEPQGLAPRSAMSPPPGMAAAREKLPPEYSDLGKTTLEVKVPLDGGTFPFDVKAVLEAKP